MKLTAYLIRSTLVGALGGLMFGFDTAVISGTTQLLTQQYNLTSAELGITVASALVGTIFGAGLAGFPAQRIGRRDSLFVMAVLYLISAIGCGLAWNWDALLAFRFVGGLGIGGSSVLGPMYIAEIAPAKWRGRLAGTFQISIVVGILVAYTSNYAIATLQLGLVEWRWQLGVAGIPAAVFFLLLFTIGRSPRWLVMQNRLGDARKVLEATGETNSEAEIRDIAASIRLDRQAKSERLFSRKYRLPIFLALSIGIFNQLSGINAVLYYLNEIFSKAGFDGISNYLQAVYVGLANLVATLIAMSFIDKLGRRTLLITGGIGMVACLILVGAIFQTQVNQQYLLLLLILFVGSFAFSQGAVIWVYLGEIFPNRVRARGISLGSTANWVVDAIVSGVFPIIALHHVALPFYFFAAMMLIELLLVIFIYPETKGLSLEEMQRKMGID
jgi:sugar porter (SP) family MFS transporter